MTYTGHKIDVQDLIMQDKLSNAMSSSYLMFLDHTHMLLWLNIRLTDSEIWVHV